MTHFSEQAETLSDKLASFFRSYDECLDHEWNSGLDFEDWKLLEQVQDVLNKSIEK